MSGDETRPCQTPRPGPMYWDWRCLVCSHPIAVHDSLARRIVNRFKKEVRS